MGSQQILAVEMLPSMQQNGPQMSDREKFLALCMDSSGLPNRADSGIVQGPGNEKGATKGPDSAVQLTISTVDSGHST
jgi:hypothetical protein